MIVLAAFWGFVVTVGFVASTLIPIINIIQYFDYPQGTEYVIPPKHGQGGDGILRTHPIPPGVIAYNILKFPLFYTMTVSILTHLIKKQIVGWFEHVLYIDDEEGGG